MVVLAAGRDTRDVIVDAAAAEILRVGLRKLSLVDVARRAGVSRQTVYRYFRDRDELVTAIVLRDQEAVLDTARTATESITDLREALRVGIAAVLRQIRDHPYLDHLLTAEAEILVPFLTSPSSTVLLVSRPVLEELVAARVPTLPVGRLRIFSELLARLLVSYTVSPPAQAPEDLAADLADLFLDGLVPTPAPTAGPTQRSSPR